jgi:opacity protein-like surface antigen
VQHQLETKVLGKLCSLFRLRRAYEIFSPLPITGVDCLYRGGMFSPNIRFALKKEFHDMKIHVRNILAAMFVAFFSSTAVAGDIQYSLPTSSSSEVPLSLIGGGCESCAQDCCCCSDKFWYGSLNLRGSFDHLESGGFNTLGPHFNTGTDDNDTFLIGGAIGVSVPRKNGRLRLEVEGIASDPFNTITNSFQPPTPTFFYQTNITDQWAVLGNTWFDMPLNECVSLYAGGGIGGGGATMTVDDGVVSGQGSSTDFVWQAGCGITRTGRLATLDLGYRYMDWGRYSVDLGEPFIGPAGDFTADITSHQLFFAVRYDSLFSRFAR